jgi:hypothetical protein
MARSESSPHWLQELLVALSNRNRPVAAQKDARALQAALSEACPHHGTPVCEKMGEGTSAEVVPLPVPVPDEMPIAAAA